MTQRGGKCCAALEVCKATTDVTQVQTDIGLQEYRTPATFAEREAAPDCLEWREADRLAVDVILLDTRNYLVTEE